eukprot:TRINITY_DN8428_c0_g1_i1.p1 TRINITY_DN8428_c0_g1~~TRINITY_DN8428_c0_g1_i1.p1  ORF type:complete len:273 (-),score=34.70 TRINITY_DN8428_c0_g1_i1:32-850(-)
MEYLSRVYNSMEATDLTEHAFNYSEKACILLNEYGLPCEPTWFLNSTLALFSLIFLYIVAIIRPKTRGNTILLLGLSDSGKTSLFLKFRLGKLRNTVTSMTVNEDTFFVHSERKAKQPIHFVDFPGFDRLRGESSYQKFLSQASAIIFMIDSVEFRSQKGSIGEFIYGLFVNPTVRKRKIPFLIACNKSELVNAVDVATIKNQIESELNQVRQTQASKPKGQGAEQTEEIFLGVEGTQFKFEQLPNKIQFVECDVVNDNLKPILAFIRKIIP